MLLTPHGVDVPWRVNQPHEVLMFAVPYTRAASLLDGADARGAAERLYDLCRTVIRDPFLDIAVRALWHESVASDAVSTLMVERAALLVLSRLARLSGQTAPAPFSRPTSTHLGASSNRSTPVLPTT